jgi:hypothetical protein
MKSDIINGYKGIMDLDLSLVDPRFHDIAVNQHYQDINQYKMEQSKLRPELRYENTVQRILQKQEKERSIILRRAKVKIQ